MTEFVSKFKAIIGLNTFNSNAFFLKLIHYSEEKQVGRVCRVFRISSKDPETRVFIDGSVLEQLELWISNS